MSELNNYTPTPVTREEKILSGADIQPRTRMEYFLKMASENGGGNVPTPTAGDVGKVLMVNSEGQLVLDYPPRDTPVPTPEDAGSVITVNEFGAYVLGEGGGSSLPPYTRLDEGKVLTVSAKDPVATETVIVPEQTVTFEEYGEAELNNVIEYTGKEIPVLGGDYAGWVYNQLLSEPGLGSYIYLDPVLGNSKAIKLQISRSVIIIGYIDDKDSMFHNSSTNSDVSATIYATVVIPVVPSTTTYIIPEQTLTASDFDLFNQFGNMYLYNAQLTSSFPTSNFYDGYKAIIDIANQRYDVVYMSSPLGVGSGPIGQFEVEEFTVGVFTDHYELMVGSEGEISDDFSLTLSLHTSVPEVEPKWQTPSSGLPAYIDFSVTFYYDDSDELQSTFSVSDFVALGKVTGLCLVTNPDGISDIQNYSQSKSGVPPTVIGYKVWKGTIQPPLHSGMSFLDPLSASVISVENSGISTYEYRATANTTNGNLEWEAIEDIAND